MTEPRTTDPMVAALLRERAGYVQAGKAERAVQVTAELARRGYVDEEPDPPPTEEPSNGPRGRTAAPRRVTTQQENS